jgi:hypothetical protein
LQVFIHLFVVDIVAFLPVGHLDLAVQFGAIADGCEAAAAQLKLLLARHMID